MVKKKMATEISLEKATAVKSSAERHQVHFKGELQQALRDLPLDAFSLAVREPLADLFSLSDQWVKAVDDSFDDSLSNHVRIQLYTLLRQVENIESAKKAIDEGTRAELINISALLRSVCRCTNFVCKEHTGIPLQADIPDRGIFVKANVKLLACVFLNILRNSYQYTRDGNRIQVMVGVKNKAVVIDVEDHGCGMAPGIQTLATQGTFSSDPFGDSHERTGMGMGLPLALHVFRRFGGTLLLHSTFGEGTTVSCSLPLELECMDVDDGVAVLPSDSDLLLNRFSQVYVQLAGLCKTPG